MFLLIFRDNILICRSGIVSIIKDIDIELGLFFFLAEATFSPDHIPIYKNTNFEKYKLWNPVQFDFMSFSQEVGKQNNQLGRKFNEILGLMCRFFHWRNKNLKS